MSGQRTIGRLDQCRKSEKVSSAAKRKIKAKGDKMLTLERYFESCGRDLSGSFVRLLIQRIAPALQWVYAFLVRARSFFKFFQAIFFSI